MQIRFLKHFDLPGGPTILAGEVVEWADREPSAEELIERGYAEDTGGHVVLGHAGLKAAAGAGARMKPQPKDK